MTSKKENLLDFVGYHEKWHGEPQSYRKKYQFNQNDFLIEEIFKRIGVEGGTIVMIVTGKQSPASFLS